MDDVLDLPLADDHFMLVVNASNIVKDFHWIAERVKEAGGDAAAVNTSSRYALIALQGPAGEGRAAVADRRRPVGDEVLLVRHRRSCGRAGRRSRAPATRAKTASRCSCRRVQQSACGTRSFRQARAPASFPRASARATRCGLRRRCGFTATTWTRRPRWSKPIWAGSSAGRRTSSSGTTC